LNPIECVWALLRHKIVEKRPQTVAHLTRAARQAWDKIDQATIDNSVLAFPSWLRECGVLPPRGV
jgi:ABC-type nitrate/sulfonate/bicarbonate transport system substrate-binding protein